MSQHEDDRDMPSPPDDYVSPWHDPEETAAGDDAVSFEQYSRAEQRLGEAMARQYLDHTGLSASDALQAVIWTLPQPIISEETVGPDAVAEYAAAHDALQEYTDYALTLWAGFGDGGQGLTDVDRRAMQKRAERMQNDRQTIDPTHYITDIPSARPYRAIVERISEDALRVQAQLREAKLDELLTTPRGRQPDAYAWLDSLGGAAPDAPAPIYVLFALERMARESAQADAKEAKSRLAQHERELATYPLLRIGTRAAKTAMVRKRHLTNAIRTLGNQKKLTAKERKQFAAAEPIALKGEEILVAAGLLWLAQQNGALRRYSPARFKKGGVVAELRLVVEKPPLEQFCRLLGYAPDASGRIPRNDRIQVEAAITNLCDIRRPIVMQTFEQQDDGRIEESYELTTDTPLKESVRDTGERYLELHPSLAAGYWHGNLKFDRLPQRWDQARDRIGARYVDDQMRWADLYFRRLVLGVLTEHQRTAASQLSLPKETPRRERQRRIGDVLPAHLTKRLSITTLLDELELQAFRKKKGPRDTAKRLAKILDFCREAGSIVGWEASGPLHYLVTFERPDDPPDEDETVQLELLPAAIQAAEIAAGGDIDVEPEQDAKAVG